MRFNTPFDKSHVRMAEGAITKQDGQVIHYHDGRIHRREWSDGTKEWWANGLLHREDGPAIEWADGSKEWHENGKRHRIDGPAIVWSDGTKEWWVNDERHRLDGPACEGEDGYREWWVDGCEVDIKSIFGYEPSVPLSVEQQMLLRLST